MKDKLQALIEEQKALTAKFEELLNSTTEEYPTPDPKKVYIKGHPTRGAEVRQMLLDYGGKIRIKWDWGETKGDGIFYIGDELCIQWASNNTTPKASEIKLTHTELHLPEEVSEVHPPAEEVELIEGEVYNVYGNIVIFKNKRANILHTIAIYRSIGSLCVDETNGYVIGSKGEWIIATPEQRKQLFDALEKAGKHFNKEKMQLLDVEEWSCKQGLPIIVRNETTNWRADIFHSYDEVDAKYPYCCNSSDECDRLYRYAMPYTEENLKIIGTTDSPDKHYKFVEK